MGRLSAIVGGRGLSVAEADAVAAIPVSRKLFQRRCHVLDRGRTILRTDGPVGVAGDVVRHSLAYPDPVGDLLERVTPSVVWL
jgi:hypothetical protein